MNKTKSIHKRFAFALLAISMASGVAADNSTEGLLNMLQKKGLLSEAEVSALRQEQKQGADAAKPAAANWASTMKISGDFRGRFEGLYADDPAAMDRNRFRYRIRAGLVWAPGEKFEAGFRLTSGEAVTGTAGGDPIGGNTSMQDNASKKLIFVDLAYGKWREVQNETWSAGLTVGKMENPFVFSDLVFDADYTPEGIAQQVTWKIDNHHTASLNLGGFAVDGIGGFETDAFLGGAQLRLESKWNKTWQSTASVAGLALTGEDLLVNGAIPNQNRGNSRSAGNSYGPGALQNSYGPVVADASVTYWLETLPTYAGRFPIKLAGDYMHNAGADTRNQGAAIGLTFGKSGKKGQWELGYRYKYLEGDAWFEELVDSDFGAFYKTAADAGGAAGYSAGTNVRGHVIKAGYSITDSFSLNASLALTELIKASPANSDSGFTRVQFDTNWKF